MGNFLNPEILQEIIVQSPADIVVAAQIVLENILSGKSGHDVQLAAQQGYISGGNGVPGACHGSNIIQKMTFRFVYSSEVGNYFLRSHNDLAQKENAGADDLADHTHHADDGMNLGKIAAIGSKLFPDIGNSVQTHDIHTLICQIEHVEDHFIQYNRISVVQIPLIRIKCCHYMLLDIVQPGEVARRRGGEYLRTGLLIKSGNVIGVKEEIAVLIFPFPCACALRPFVILGGMVHNEVQTYADSAFMAGGSNRCEILHGSQFRLYGTEICHSVTAVAAPFRGSQKRHQMQIVHITFLNIIQLFLKPFQGL